MLRKTFFAVLTVLAAAVSSQAAVILQPSAPTMLDNGLQSVILSAVSNAGEIINGINNPQIGPNAGGAGLHQVWMPLLGATPTEGDHNPLAFNPAWEPYDSYFFFTPANSLSIGGAFTETNNETGGAAGLPPGGAGPARTGFGTIDFSTGSASKGFTIASGNQSTSVEFAQLVFKQGESVLANLGVLDNDGIIHRFDNFVVDPNGGIDVLTIDPASRDLPGRVPAQQISELFQALLNGGPITDATFAITGVQKDGAAGVPVNAPSITDGNFGWLPHLNDLNANNDPASWQFAIQATRGDLTADATLTVGLVIPEPATFTLFGLALVGCFGLIRRR